MCKRKSRKIMIKITVFLTALSLCAPAIGKIIYVDADAVGANTGSSWTDAYNYLQDALADANTAEKPVEILVAQGIYKPDEGVETNLGDRSATFQLINGVAIYGGYAGAGEPSSDSRDIELFETILSGDLDSNDIDVNNPEDLLSTPDRADNSYQVVTGSGTDETAVLDGFTITGGNAYIFTNRDGAGLVNEYGSPQISNCTFTYNSAQYFGGGIYNYYSSPTILNCTFMQNSVNDRGGGIYNYYSNPTITNCAFMQNSANGRGGGTYNYRGSPVLTNCTFSNNSGWSDGGGMHSSHGSSSLTDCTFIGNSSRQGGGAYSDDNSATFINCTFTKNLAEDEGGGLYSQDNKPNLNNCTFIENSAQYGGGGMCCNSSDPNMTDCTFMENSAHYGGGMYNMSSNPILTNCILIANSGFTYGGGMYNISSSLTLKNCIIAANQAYSYGGGMSCNSSDSNITNCTFTENSATKGKTIACNSPGQRRQSDIILTNCILWDDGNAIWKNDRSTVTIFYSNIKGGWEGEGNIDADPLFSDFDNGDYHLKSQAGRWDPVSEIWMIDEETSPCIDAGDPKSPVLFEPFPNGGIINMGAYGGTSAASKSP